MSEKVNTVCRVCGKKYWRCRSCEDILAGSWRLVACSPECWAVWCDKIQARRKPQADSSPSETPREMPAAQPVPTEHPARPRQKQARHLAVPGTTAPDALDAAKNQEAED